MKTLFRIILFVTLAAAARADFSAGVIIRNETGENVYIELYAGATGAFVGGFAGFTLEPGEQLTAPVQITSTFDVDVNVQTGASNETMLAVGTVEPSRTLLLKVRGPLEVVPVAVAGVPSGASLTQTGEWLGRLMAWEVFMAGFVAGCLCELGGLMIRTIRNTLVQPTGV